MELLYPFPTFETDLETLVFLHFFCLNHVFLRAQIRRRQGCLGASALMGELPEAPGKGSSGEELCWKSQREAEALGLSSTWHCSGTEAVEEGATPTQRKLLQAVINSFWILLLSPANSA